MVEYIFRGDVMQNKIFPVYDRDVYKCSTGNIEMR